jgi:hypothetical protein
MVSTSKTTTEICKRNFSIGPKSNGIMAALPARIAQKPAFNLELVNVAPVEAPYLRADFEARELSRFGQMTHHSPGKAEPVRNVVNQ